MVRMDGADSNNQQTNQDVFGRSLFYGDACKVVHQYGAYYEVLAGTAYVAGIRFFYPGMQELLIEEVPNKIWLDVSWPSDSMLDREPAVDTIVSEDDLKDYIDSKDVAHFLKRISEVSSSRDLKENRVLSVKEKKYISRDQAKISDNFSVEKIVIIDLDNAPYERISEDEADQYFDEAKFQDVSGQWWGVDNSNGVMLKWFGAKNVTEYELSFDSYLLAQKAISLFGNLVISGGCFYFSKTVSINRSCKITGNALIYIGSDAFYIYGDDENEYAITQEITSFSEMEVHANTGLKQGDYAFIHSDVNCLSKDALNMQLGSSTSSDPRSWFGEFIIVKSNNNGILKLVSPLVFNNYKIQPLDNSGARQKSTVKKINFVEVEVAGLSFKRINHGYSTIHIIYGKDCLVYDCTFLNDKNAGSSVIYEKSLNSEVKNCKFKLDENTIIKYGNVNPSAEEYYLFNMVKMISSQGCAVSNSEFWHGTQNVDVTYRDSPSINCMIVNNKVYYARHNMLTSHSGNIGTVFDGNIGMNVWRGISARSRQETVTNNTIIGFQGIPYHEDTQNVTYAVAITEGYSINTSVNNNRMSGFERLLWVNNYSARETGHDYYRIYVSGNTFGYCKHSIVIYKRLYERKTVQSSFVIANNVFYSYASSPVRIESAYVNQVEVLCNSFLDTPSDNTHIVRTNGNCLGIKIAHNTFPESLKIAWIKEISDEELGEDSPQGSKTQSIGNLITNNMLINGWTYGNEGVSQGGFSPHLPNTKYVRIDESDFILKCDTVETIRLGAQTPTTISAFEGGTENQIITFIGNSSANTVTIKNTDKIKTKTSEDIILGHFETARFIKYTNDVWVEI